MDKTKLDLNNFHHKLIVGAMAELVSEGMTAHEVFSLLEDIKRQTWPSLAEIQREDHKKGE